MPIAHGGELVARSLASQGIEKIFILCGEYISSIYDGCLKNDIMIIDFRREQAVAHAADANARLTRNIGVAQESFYRCLERSTGSCICRILFDVLFNVEEAPKPSLVERTRPILPEPTMVEQIAGLIRQAKELLIIAGSQVYWDEAGEALR